MNRPASTKNLIFLRSGFYINEGGTESHPDDIDDAEAYIVDDDYIWIHRVGVDPEKVGFLILDGENLFDLFHYAITGGVLKPTKELLQLCINMMDVND